MAKLFNGCITLARQADVENWIKERYPQNWTRLAAKDYHTRYNDTKVLPLDVRMDP